MLQVFKLKPNDRPTIPRNKIRRFCYQVAINQRFDTFMMVVVVFNLSILSCAYYDMPEDEHRILENLNTACSSIYILEALLKILALFWPTYWMDDWNKFDFCLATLCVIEFALSFLR